MSRPRFKGPLTWSDVVSSVTTDGDTSATTTTSTPINCGGMDAIGFVLKWAATGTPVGTIDVRVCQDFDPGKTYATSGNWATLDRDYIANWAAIQPAGTAAAHLLTVPLRGAARAEWIVILYTKTSGTGTLNGWAQAV